MKHVDEKTKEVDLAADWKKEMHKYPDPKSSFDIVDLEEAMIEQPKEASGIAADHISLYLVRKTATSARPAPTCRRHPVAPSRVPSSTTCWRSSERKRSQ